MLIRLEIGTLAIELAGGVASEESDFSKTSNPVFQSGAYIGSLEGYQYQRPGTMQTVSFGSTRIFASMLDAQAYALNIDRLLLDQSGMTCAIGMVATQGTQQTETLTAASNATSDGSYTYSFTSAHIGTIAGSLSYLTGATPLQRMTALAAELYSRSYKMRLLYTLTPSSTGLLIACNYAMTNDSTLALSTGAGNGFIAQTSANGSSGVLATLDEPITLNQASLSLRLARKGVRVDHSCTIIGRYTA